MLCIIFYFYFFCTVHWADLSWPPFHYWLYPVWLCMWQINENLEPWSWTFSLHDAPAKPTASWRTPPTPPTVSSSSYHQEDGTGASEPCESPELRSPHPLWNPMQTPTSWNMDPPPPLSKHPPTLPHQRKICETVLCNSKCATHRWVGLYKPPVVTHSPLCTRHFSHTAVCTQSHKRLSNICMFTCSCTTNHLVLFPSQLLDSQCFSLHMYSIYVKHSYSLYFFIFYL